MINRALIRIKVIQLLYSYLLTEKQFTIEPQPSQPTKEKRFAYKIYLDTLALMVGLANSLGPSRGVNKFAAHRFIDTVKADDRVRAILMRTAHGETNPLESCLDALVEEVKNTGAFKQYGKTSKTTKGHQEGINTEVLFWQTIFNQVIWTSEAYNKAASRFENYSLRGMDRMFDMMSVTFKNFFSSGGHIEDALRQLAESLGMSRELYFRLLALPVALTDVRDEAIEAGRHKHLPTDEDLNPDMRLSENTLVAKLRDCSEIWEYMEQKHISLQAENPDLLRRLLKAVMTSDIYLSYQRGELDDNKFWRLALQDIVVNNVDFLEEMENKSVFWNDDLEFMTDFAVKTFKRLDNHEPLSSAILPMYKDTEDSRFGADLFTCVVEHKDELKGVIDESLNTDVWESERLAFMDVIIMITALAEMLYFPAIPMTVTMNEYLEMAKYYSTQRSDRFINGLLAVAITKLQNSGRLLK